MILDVKIRVPRFEGNSWLAFPTFRGAYKHVQIYIEFKPEKSQGMILLTGIMATYFKFNLNGILFHDIIRKKVNEMILQEISWLY